MAYDQAKVEQLMQDTGIIRNRLKILAFITNARAYMALEGKGQNLSDYLWAMVDNQPLRVEAGEQRQEIADKMSHVLKQQGFRFVGPTICYAFMQACGLLNDHEEECFLNLT